MEPTGRLYVCARCRTQVVICSRCDRGQRYCAGSCSMQAHRESRRAANRRYQQSRRGRFLHAACQKRYRQRRARRKNVTDHGSATVNAHALLAARPLLLLRAAPAPFVPVTPSETVCAFCARLLSDFVRTDYVRRERRRGRRSS